MTQYTACNTNTVSAVRTNTLNKYCTTLSVYKLLFVSHSMHMRIQKYCVTFSEKQEDYHVLYWGIPPGKAKSCDYQVSLSYMY